MRKILSLCAAFLFAAGMMADPIALPATLDVNNVSFRSPDMPNYVIAEGDTAGTYFDMGAHDSSNDTALYAEWDVTIQPMKYNVAVYVYNLNSWTVGIRLVNQAGTVVKELNYHGSSQAKGLFSAGVMDLSDLEAGNYKVRAHSNYAWSKLKLKEVIFEGDYHGVNVDLPGELLPAYSLLFGNATATSKAISFKPSTADTDYATWNVSFAKAGEYKVAIDITASNGHNYGVALLSEDGTTEIAAVNEGGQKEDTGEKELGAITVAAAGKYVIKLTNAIRWSEAVLNKIKFIAPASAVPTEAAPVPTWPAAQVVSLYSDSYTFAPASLNSYNEGWYRAPSLTEEEISENHFLHYNGDMGGMIGWQFGDIAVTTMEYIHVDIWPSANTTLKMGPTTPNDHGNAVASVAIEVVAGKWNSIDIPVSALEAANAEFSLADVFQNQFTQYSDLTDLSVDNVFFYRTTPYVDPTKPTDFTAVLTGNSYFSVTIKANAKDDSGAVLYDVINGELVVATGSAASGADANIVVKDLAPNTEYNFKVVAKDATGNATDPITVAAATKEAPAPAKALAFDADDVKAIYSNAFTPCTAISTLNAGWWEAPEMAEGELAAGDKALFYAAKTTGMIGWEFGEFDATGFQFLHVDIYPLASGSIVIYPVNKNPAGEYKTTVEVVGREWKHIVIDLSDKNLSALHQIGWIDYYALNGFFIDNVYLAKTAAPVVTTNTCADVYSMAKNDAVNLNDVTVTYSSGANVWVKDATGAMLIYLPSGFTNTFKAGDVLSGVAGVVDIYQTIVYEVKPSAEQAAAIQATAGEAPAALEVTAIANSDVNQYVVLKGASITGEFTTASKTSLTATIGENTITVYNNFKKAFTFAEGKTYDITGVVSAYNGKAQVYFISAEEGTSTAINNAVVSEKAVKMIENGQLIIMKNGVKYNAQGAELR